MNPWGVIRRRRLARRGLLGLSLFAAVAAAVVQPAGGASGALSPSGLPPANPLYPGRIILPNRNLPDPFVLERGSHYYLYSGQTGLYAPPASLTESTGPTIFSWGETKAVLTGVPVWAENGFTWAPDVHEVSSHDFVMYFDAWVKKSIYFDRQATGFSRRAQCIGYATATSPAGPFTPQGTSPLVCQLSHHGDIDPRTFVSPSGQLWLDWKSDDNAFRPARRTTLWAQRLTADGEHLRGGRSVLLTAANNSWTGGLIEAPDMVHNAGRYWLFFSGSWFNGPHYAIGIAQCKNPWGTCSLVGNKALLSSNAQGTSPGEESIFHNKTGWWMVYSPWGIAVHSYRPVALARLAFGPRGIYLAKF
ncbi:MAG: family 43 glycosylhydrolase [Acidimicrobiales bacterium]